jgi:lipopolysaccharide/colanic/teichoic acid biosynthesis glycosyltransferase
MNSILYIGNNINYITDYGFNSLQVRNIEWKTNSMKAFDFLHQTKCLPEVIFCESMISGINAHYISKILRSYKKFNSIVFILIEKKPLRKKNIYALKSGVDEIIEPQISLLNFLPRLNFLIKYRKNRKNLRRISKLKKVINHNIIKRLFDITIALLALIILSPIILITIIALKIESKDPVFYSSKRSGRGYKVFDFYKFRSMHINADKKLDNMKSLNQYINTETEAQKKCLKCTPSKNCSPILYVENKKICENQFLIEKKAQNFGTFIKIKEDPRVTKVGKFIRNTSIDELPQLINVLKGDMSIVGNRPLPLYEAELLTSDQWSKRFQAPAGITGLWQVEKRGKSEMSEEKRKSLDNQYAIRNTFFYDIKLILRTIPALFQSENV